MAQVETRPGDRIALFVPGSEDYVHLVMTFLAAGDRREDIAVFGVDDERWGQRVCAAVVGDVESEVLAAFARDRLAPSKRPKDYFKVAELPRTPTGKVRRLELSDLLGLRK